MAGPARGWRATAFDHDAQPSFNRFARRSGAARSRQSVKSAVAPPLAGSRSRAPPPVPVAQRTTLLGQACFRNADAPDTKRGRACSPGEHPVD